MARRRRISLRRVMKRAQRYRKKGMSLSRAMKKAWKVELGKRR